MSGLLQVLVIEDNPDDAELIARALRRNGFEFDWQRVDTQAGLLRVLERRPDVILSDYNLSGWTGIDAFETLRKAGHDVPFILVTGALGDEAAVECLKRGMADYVLKDNLRRLPLAVRRALGAHQAQLERKRAEEVLKSLARGTAQVTGEAFFPALVENLARALGVRWALVGQLRGDEQETVETLALWDADHLADNITYELAGAPCGDVIRERRLCVHTEGVQARFPKDTLLREMGAECYVGAPLCAADGSAVGLVAVLDERPYRPPPGVEETFQVFAARAAAELERLQKVAALEEAAQEWRRTFDTMGDMVTIHDTEFRIVRANRAAARTFGHEPEDMIGQQCYQVFHQLDCPVENCPLRRSLRSGEMETLEIWEPTIDKHLLVTTNPIRDAEGRLTGVVHVARDITTRKRTEATLRALNAAAADLQRAGLAEAEIYGTATEHLTALGLRGAITLFDEAADSFVFQHIFLPAGLLGMIEELSGIQSAGFRLPRARVPAFAQVAETGQAVCIPDSPDRLVAKLLPASKSGRAGQIAEMLGPASAILAPLRMRDRVMGVLYVASEWVTEADVPAITAFADQLSAALENARLYWAERERAAQLAVVNSIGQRISSILDMDAILDEVTHQIAETLDYYSVAVALVEGDELVYRAARGGFDDSIDLPDVRFKIGEGSISGWVAATGQALHVGDVSQEPRFQPDPLLPYVASELAVPLKLHDRVLGVLDVESDRPNAFSETDEALLTTLAGQIAIALENAGLYEAERRRTAELARSNSLITALGHVAARIETAPDPDGVVETLGAELKQVGFDSFVAVLEPDGQSVTLHYVSLGSKVLALAEKLVGRSWRGFRMPRERWLHVSDVFEKGSAAYFTDTESRMMAFLPDLARPILERVMRIAGVSSETPAILLPLKVEEQVVGALGMWGADLREGDAPAATVFASQVAGAIERARLFDETRRRAEETTALLTTAQAVTMLDLDAVLETIAGQARTFFQADGSRIHLIEPDGETLRCAVALHDRAEVVKAVRLKLGQGFTGRVALNGEPELILNTLADPQAIQVPGTPVEPEAVALTPLKVGGSVIGVMTVTRLGEDRSFSESNLAMLTAFANQAAVAIDNARLYEKVRRRAAHLEALNAVIAEAAGAPDLSNLLEVSLGHTLQALGLEIGAIWITPAPGVPSPHSFVCGLPSELSSQIGQDMAEAASVGGWDICELQAVEDWQSAGGRLSEMASTVARSGIRASLIIPIMSEDRRIGGLSVAAPAPRPWTAEEIALAEAVGRQLGGAVQRLRLLEQARTRAELMDRLAAAGETLNRPLDFDEVVAAIGQAALELGSPDRAVLYLRNPDDTVACPWSYGLSPAYLEQVTTRAREMPGGRLFDSTDPVLVPDAMQLPEDSPLRSLAETEGHRAIGLWPLVYERRVVAVVGCYHDAPHRWTAAEREAMGAFTRQAAVALENARLYIETRRRAEELGVLADVSTALREAGTVEEMVPVFVEKAVEAVNGVAGTIFLFESGTGDPSTGSGQAIVARGRYPPEREPLDVRHLPGEGITGHVYVTGELHFSEDLASDPLVQMQPGEAELLSAVRSAIALPLRTQEQIVGVMHVGLGERRTFTGEEVRLLTAIAEVAGNSLHRAALHEQTTRHLQRLTAIRNIDRAISSSLDLKVVLNVLLTQLTGQPRVDAADVLLFHPRTQTLEYAAGYGFYTTALQHTRLRLGEGLAGQAALEQQTVSISDFRFQISDLESGRRPEMSNLQSAISNLQSQIPDPGQVSNLKSAISNLKSEGFTAYFGVPLISKGQVQGVLEIYQREPKAHDPHWLEFLEAVAAQAAIAIDNATLLDQAKSSNLELTLAYDVTLEGWARALELRDAETEGHTRRVTAMVLRLAREMGLNGSTLAHIRRGALLHDIGKLGIPDSVLLKPGELEDEEWDIIRLHPVYAYELLSPISYLRPALEIPYCHHEWWDGSGYPRGLKGEQIPLPARIFAVVDVYDALRSDRPYRLAWPEEEVRSHIREWAGTHFDPAVVEVFMKILENGL